MRRVSHVQGLDSIRFVCAIAVMFSHETFFPLFDRLPSSPVVRLLNTAYHVSVNGVAAVVVFFVISGFCIHYPNVEAERPDWKSYYLRRFIRIGVPLAAAVLLSRAMRYGYSVYRDSILWSLVAEMIYYALYPGLLWMKRRLGGWPRLILLSYGVSLALILTRPPTPSFHEYGDALNWLLALPCWLLGCQLAEKTVLRGVPPAAPNPWPLRGVVFFAGSAALVLAFHSPIGYPYTMNLYALLVYYWLGLEIARFRQFPPPAALEWAGKWSYSVYLMHTLGYRAWDALGPRVPSPELAWIARFGFTLAFSYAFFLAAEAPAFRWIRKIKRASAG